MNKKLLVSMVYDITAKSEGNREFCPNAYPWDEGIVPIRIDAEYPNFYVATVMPHIHNRVSFGTSTPYTITVDKWDLKVGNLRIVK